jgi:N6-adenosine-specific RNA methylase IME4
MRYRTIVVDPPWPAHGPGPYLDMFARRARLGWDVWGDEAPGSVELGA